MKPRSIPRPLLTALAAGFGLWFLLEWARPRSAWVTATAPDRALAGESLAITVRLSPPVDSGHLCVDLHGRRDRSESVRVIGVSDTLLSAGQATYEVRVPITSNAPAGRAQTIVYLSPTGRWRDRTAAASGDFLRILPQGESHLAPRAQTPKPRRLSDVGADTNAPRRRSAPLRVGVSILWALGLALTANQRLRRTPTHPHTESEVPPKVVRFFSLICAVLVLSQAFDLAGWAGNAARGMARSLDAYESREWPQQAAVAVLGAMILGGLRHLIRLPLSRGWRLSLIAVFTGLGLECLDALSLHAVDSLVERPFLGIAWLQWAQAACAFAMLLGLAGSVFPGSRGNPFR